MEKDQNSDSNNQNSETEDVKVEELNDDALILATSESLSLPDEDVFILSSGALGNIDYVYIASD